MEVKHTEKDCFIIKGYSLSKRWNDSMELDYKQFNHSFDTSAHAVEVAKLIGLKDFEIEKCVGGWDGRDNPVVYTTGKVKEWKRKEADDREESEALEERQVKMYNSLPKMVTLYKDDRFTIVAEKNEAKDSVPHDYYRTMILDKGEKTSYSRLKEYVDSVYTYKTVDGKKQSVSTMKYYASKFAQDFQIVEPKCSWKRWSDKKYEDPKVALPKVKAMLIIAHDKYTTLVRDSHTKVSEVK